MHRLRTRAINSIQGRIDAYLPHRYQIKRELLASTQDMRSDQRIHHTLKAAGILVR